MSIVRLTSLEAPELQVFSRLTERQLRSVGSPSEALFIAESPKVILAALEMGCEPVSLLCEERHLSGDASPILARCPHLSAFTGSRELLSRLTGYMLTRGVLCAMRRPQEPSAAEVCRDARRVVVIDAVCDSTNIGSIFRAAAAFGLDGVLLTRDSCDPLNRRALRVSMGTALRIPWAWVDDPVGDLHALGFRTAAMALRSDSLLLSSSILHDEPRLAIIMGTEGDGLPSEVIDASDYVVCIPMHRGVDSLNVASAAAVAFYELGRR